VSFLRLHLPDVSINISPVFAAVLLQFSILPSLRMSPMLRIAFVFLVLPVFFAGCAQMDERPPAEPIYWPEPPDLPRFVYETSLRTTESIKSVGAESRLRVMLTGATGEKPLFAKPFGVAAKSGMVVVTDTVRRIGYIFNLSRQRIYRFGHVGASGNTNSTKGLISKPMGVTIDNEQRILVADVTVKKVYIYDLFGMFLQEIGGPDIFDRPVDVAVSNDGSRIYVIDAGGIDSLRHRVVVFDRDGKLLFEIGWRGAGDGEFNLPTQIAVAPDDTIYVLDAGNFRVQVFTPDGEFLRAWGEVGRSFGNFARPRGLAIDRDGNVYVTDAAYRNFQIFTPEGRLLLAIGGEGLMDEPGQYTLPAGIAVDELGYVYVVGQLFAKVDVIRRLSEQEAEQIVASRRSGVLGGGEGMTKVTGTPAPGASKQD
jgi:DNA-binding beta-propeller fold protein YncE